MLDPIDCKSSFFMSLRKLIERANICQYTNIKMMIKKTFEFNGQILTFKKMSVIEDKYTNIHYTSRIRFLHQATRQSM